MKSLQTNLSWVFFGTDIFAVKVLETLALNNLLPGLIVTTSDTHQGRHLTLTSPPVKLWAEQNNIEFVQSLSSIPFSPYSLYLVASYGKIIPEKVFDLPKHGTLNIHPSLLPKYRGASPIQSAILNGDTETGVTIMMIDKEVDHGAIVAQDTLTLSGEETFENLRDSLAKLGAELFTKILPNWLDGKIEAKEQNHAKATFTKKITKQDGEIKLVDDAVLNYRKYRALSPKPGCYFFNASGKRVIIKKAQFKNGKFTPLRVVPEGHKETNY